MLPTETGTTGTAAIPTATGPTPMAPVLGSVIAVVMAVAFPVVLTGAMSFKMRADIGFDSRAQAAVVTSYFLVSAVISTSCGRLTERFGSRCSMRVAAVLGGLACAGIALSDRLALLATFMVVGGVSAADSTETPRN